MTIRAAAGLLVGVLLSDSSALAPPAQAQESVQESAADFYKGKQIRIIAASAAGGGFDFYARYLARHLGKHVPGNPGVIVQNMPGAGGLAASNHMHTRAAKDGLTIGILQGPLTYARRSASRPMCSSTCGPSAGSAAPTSARTPACSRNAPA
jgi:tripartite-type tricarboxylate transporter receptor subunit TctC